MKTQAEVYQALLDGKVIVNSETDCCYKLIGGELTRLESDTNIWEKSTMAFFRPEKFSIQEPEREKYYIWRYENPSGSWSTTTMYYSKDFKTIQGVDALLSIRGAKKHICIEFKPIYSDGSYADD